MKAWWSVPHWVTRLHPWTLFFTGAQLQQKTLGAGGFSSSSPLFKETSLQHLVWFTCGSCGCRELDVSYVQTQTWVFLSWHECFNYNLTCHLPFSSSNIWKKIEAVNVFCKSLFIWIRWGWKHISRRGSQTEGPHSCHQGDWDMREDPSKAGSLVLRCCYSSAVAEQGFLESLTWTEGLNICSDPCIAM